MKAYKLECAEHKNFIALKAAFKIIDSFAEPTLTPSVFSGYHTAKKKLLKTYKPKK